MISGVYVILDPIHFEQDEWGQYLDERLPEGGRFVQVNTSNYNNNYKCFIFETAYGSGTFPIVGPEDPSREDGVYPVGVDSDTGVIAVVPYEYIHELNNPYTNWMVANSMVVAMIRMCHDFTPIVRGHKLILGDNITVDTASPEQTGYEHFADIVREDPNYRMSRHMSAYLLLKLLYQNVLEEEHDEDKENYPIDN